MFLTRLNRESSLTWYVHSAQRITPAVLLNLPFEPDAIIECTGVGQLISDSIGKIGANGIICLTGIGHGGAAPKAATADVAAAAVLRNNVIVGSVNANKRHWYRAAQILANADRAWLAKLITRREKPENFMRLSKESPMISKL